MQRLSLKNRTVRWQGLTALMDYRRVRARPKYDLIKLMGSPHPRINRSILKPWSRGRPRNSVWPYSNRALSLTIPQSIQRTFEIWSELISKWLRRKLIRPSARYEIVNFREWCKILILLKRKADLVPRCLQCQTPTSGNGRQTITEVGQVRQLQSPRYSKLQKRGGEDLVAGIAVQIAQI